MNHLVLKMKWMFISYPFALAAGEIIALPAWAQRGIYQGAGAN